VIHTLLLGSTIGQVFQPLYEALAWVMAMFYALIPNFAVAIALLTVAVMVVTSPLTVKSTRSTIAMQRLAPELKKIQQKYKGDKATLNEEMMKLYREHNINPAGGCLPMLIQLPVFVVLYGVIRGLTNTVKRNGKIVAEPRYISKNTHLYHQLLAANGHMKAFGLDLAGTLFTHHAHWYDAVPYGAIVLVAIGLQYLQMRQLNSRNQGAAQANPQMQMMQRYMPLIFAVIYLRISAGVNVYFVVSSLCRIGIQEAIFRSGVLDKAPSRRQEVLPSRRDAGPPRRRTLMERLADAQQRALEQQKQQKALQAGLQADVDASRDIDRPGGAKRPPGNKTGGPKSPSSRPNGQRPAGSGPPTRKSGAPPSGADRKAGTPPSGNSGARKAAPSGSSGSSSGDGDAGRPARPGGQKGPARTPGSSRGTSGAPAKGDGSSANGDAGDSRQDTNGKATGNEASAPTSEPPSTSEPSPPESARKRPRKAR